MSKKHDLLKALARCRIVQADRIEEILNIPESTAVACMSEGLVEQKKENGRTYYLLSDEAELYIKKEIPVIKQIYRGFVLEQDIRLMEFYGQLDEKIKDTWKTKDDFIVQFQLAGTVDGAYVNNSGEMVGVKVLSNKANFSTVERVEKFLREVNLPQVCYLTYTPS